jgi:tripartite-type tricarboxylate transporter receptor subunit TctC
MNHPLSLLRIAALAVAALAAVGARAQPAYPARPIQLIVGYAAGGGTDLLARIVAAKMGEGLGQPVVIENKVGAQSIIAAQYVAKANPDGYTLLLGPSGPMSMNPALYSKLPYAPLRDFAPISLLGSFPLILAVSQNHPAKTPFQLAAELFKQKTGTAFQHIAYKGSNESVNATATGEVTMTLADPPPLVGQVKAGRVRALAITTPARHPAWPDVPTMREAGFADMDIALWTGILAPAGTPPAIIRKLQDEVARVLRLPDVRERILALGIDPVASTPEEFSRVIAADIVKWTAVAKAANIKAD